MEAGLENDPDDYLTLSAVRLSEVGELESCMEQFASVMTGQVEGGNLSAVRRGRSRMYTFGSFVDASWDMVDLGAVLDSYAQFDPRTRGRGEAEPVRSGDRQCARRTTWIPAPACPS